MTMTLEQVRDVLKGWPTRTIDRLSLHEADEMASAIVAYLTDRDEVTRTCRICGGQVDLSNAVKPDMMDTKGWHANARTVSDRYSSGSAQCKEPSQLINADLKSPVREYEKMNVEANEFTRDGIESQPQPVAQGEAVVEFYVKCVRCHGEGMADIYVGSTGGSFMDPPDPVFERDACPECEGACFVPTTPSIPTAQRVVPVEPHTNDNYEQDENGCVDVYSEGHKDGWNSCRESMLAAAPDAGGV